MVRQPPPRNIYRRASAARALTHQEPLCGIKAQCGACKYVNLEYEPGLLEKQATGLAFLEKAGVLAGARLVPPAKAPKTFGYRSLFKLAVRPGRGTARFAIGLFEQGSHAVVDMDDCPLHTPPLKALIRDLRAELEASPLTPYDEGKHTGQIRYVAARSAHLTGELMVTFVVTEPLKVELRRLIGNLQRRGHTINSAHMNLNTVRGNAIFGPETVRLAGSNGLRERVCDLDFEVGPTSFFQINPWQAINLYRRVEQIVGQAPGAVAWDLYCGIGQISLVLARLGYRVLGIEENARAVADATDNAKKNHLDEQATFLAARVEDAKELVPAWAKAPELIIANPSRRGLAETTRKELAALLKANRQCRFIYVSCNAETLARDLKELTAGTGFQVRQVEPFDMFPQTDNMEWLAVLTHG